MVVWLIYNGPDIQKSSTCTRIKLGAKFDWNFVLTTLYVGVTVPFANGPGARHCMEQSC